MTIRYRARRTDSGTVNIATITHKSQPTRNPGGRYTLAWGVAENGTIYRTQQSRGARPPWRQATTAEAVAAPSAVAIAALDAARAALREAHAAFRRDAADAKYALGAADAADYAAPHIDYAHETAARAAAALDALRAARARIDDAMRAIR